MGFIPYGARWRTVRRAFHAHFHPMAVKAYEPLETVAAHRLLRNLLEEPNEFRQHTRQCVLLFTNTAIMNAELIWGEAWQGK
jgi:cytochrome P450